MWFPDFACRGRLRSWSEHSYGPLCSFSGESRIFNSHLNSCCWNSGLDFCFCKNGQMHGRQNKRALFYLLVLSVWVCVCAHACARVYALLCKPDMQFLLAGPFAGDTLYGLCIVAVFVTFTETIRCPWAVGKQNVEQWEEPHGVPRALGQVGCTVSSVGAFQRLWCWTCSSHALRQSRAASPDVTSLSALHRSRVSFHIHSSFQRTSLGP